MALKEIKLNKFRGFGSGDKFSLGEYYWSENFRNARKGITPSIKVTSVNSSVSLTNLTTIQWYAERGGDATYGIADNGRIFKNAAGTITEVRNPGGHGNGLIVDQKNRLLYAQDGDMGMFDGTTWTDSWKSFGASYTDYRPMERAEDLILVGCGNTIGILDSSDAFSASGFTLPTSFTIRCIKAGSTGYLVGANVAGKGYLILWDAFSDRSIAPWIPLDVTVQSIATDEDGSWIVTTAKGFVKTNGYTIAPFHEMPNRKINDLQLQSVIPGGTLITGKKLLVAFTQNSLPLARLPIGFYFLDLKTKFWEYAPIHTRQQTNISMGAVFLDSSLTLHCAYRVVTPTSTYYISKITNDAPSKAIFISPELADGEAWKYAEALVLSLAFDPSNNTRLATYTWTVTAKIYTFDRQLHGYGICNGGAANATTFPNDASNSLLKSAQVGDEIVIMGGVNAGLTRKITAIANPGTSSEVWTLDSAMNGNTESLVYAEILPFKAIETRTVRAGDDYFFNIKNKYKGKKFLIKLIFEGTSQMFPELTELKFIYDEQEIL